MMMFCHSNLLPPLMGLRTHQLLTICHFCSLSLMNWSHINREQLKQNFGKHFMRGIKADDDCSWPLVHVMIERLIARKQKNKAAWLRNSDNDRIVVLSSPLFTTHFSACFSSVTVDCTSWEVLYCAFCHLCNSRIHCCGTNFRTTNLIQPSRTRMTPAAGLPSFPKTDGAVKRRFCKKSEFISVLDFKGFRSALHCCFNPCWSWVYLLWDIWAHSTFF